MFSYQTTTALITGATSGIGAAITNALANQGIPTLVLVARQEADLHEMADTLRKRGHRVETIAIDLSEANAPAQVKARTDRLNLTIDLLINDAGIGDLGAFDEQNRLLLGNTATDIIALNVAALVGLTEAYLPGIVARGTGGVLNLGSTAAFQPVPYSAIYGASKAFVLSFTQAIWAELRDRGFDQIRMVCLCPGVTDTPFGLGHGEMRGQLGKLSVSTPDDVAQTALWALDHNVPYAIVGTANRVLAKGVRFISSPLAAAGLARIRRQEVRQRGTRANRWPMLPTSLLRSASPILGFLAGSVGWLAYRRLMQTK